MAKVCSSTLSSVRMPLKSLVESAALRSTQKVKLDIRF
jgi:hypothetical protein